jgi:hypothetical protein
MGSEALRSLLCQPVDFYQRPESTSTISDKNRVLRYTRADFAELNRLCHAKLHCPKGESDREPYFGQGEVSANKITLPEWALWAECHGV